MRKRVIASLEYRILNEMSKRSPLKYLKRFRIERYLDKVISVLYLYTRPKKGAGLKVIFMTEVICAIGHKVRSELKLTVDSSVAAKTGAFILYTFEELGWLKVQLTKGNRHGTYIIDIIDDDAICRLWESLPTKCLSKLPSTEPFPPWNGPIHESGLKLVKTKSERVLAALSPESHPEVFDSINRAQRVGWTVNEDIYDLHLWALRNKTDAFADIWEQQNKEAKRTKLREVRTIGSIAERFLGETFYHQYYLDFRGRRYTNTAYFNEQGSDIARALLKRVDKKPITSKGYYWMMIGLANLWAGDAGREDGLKSDKIPLRERFLWAEDNEEIFRAYAENPKLNQGWMKADKPWQFLVFCIELCKLRRWQRDCERGPFRQFQFESSLEVFIDGTTNGSQHLTLLTKDEDTAAFVNLVPLELPGDLYSYVASHVWETIETTVDDVADRDIIEEYIDVLLTIKRRIANESRLDKKNALIDQLRSIRKAEPPNTAEVFWSKITDLKERRKIVKRNVMTLPL